MQNTNNTQDKKVGVVIPIYNVAQYLRECIDSVLSQTYKNLSIVLVNDGSTDNESLDIAKEYVAKDPRFILIDKENGGLSSARNVGIAWYSEKYETKLDNSKDSFFVAQNDNQNNNNNNKETFILLQYDIVNENPYNVYKIYANKEDTNSLNENDKEIKDKSLQPEKIDYIIFLDSDDYWRLDCIDRCMEYSDGVDIVWFDFLAFYDEDRKKTWNKTLQEYFNFEKSMYLTGTEWLDYYVDKKFNNFYFAWSGLIDFNFLKDIGLYYLDGVIHEDHNFGCLLFLQSENIYVLKDKLYLYRIRQNSITTAGSNTPIPYYAKHIYDAFAKNNKARQYHKKSSMFLSFLEFVDFLDKNPNPNDTAIRKHFLPFYANYCESLITFRTDPLNIIPKMGAIVEFLPDNYSYINKLRMKNPSFNKKFTPFFIFYNIYKEIKDRLIKIFSTKLTNKIYKIAREIATCSVLIWILVKVSS